jgi:uncharacterized protein (TIGR03118 family)
MTPAIKPQRLALVMGGALALTLGFLSPLSATTSDYSQTNLVSDLTTVGATTVDPNLKNPWGLAFGPTSPFWVANVGTNTATIYNGQGAALLLVVNMPSGQLHFGILFNGTTGFDSNINPAAFIFAGGNGTISGWNGGNGTSAVTTAFGSTPSVFTGLAMGTTGENTFLYAANPPGGTINVFDSTFALTSFAGKFLDPTLPAGYVPFNIQNIGGYLYVTYTQGTGLGIGIVNVFDTAGNLIQRLITGGALDAPYGITIAPAGFGVFSNDLLVGNSGNGQINAFNPTTGAFLSTLNGSNGQPLVIDNLHALAFGNNGPNANPLALYFTAGINNQTDGLFGAIAPTATPEPSTLLLLCSGLVGVVAYRWRRRCQDNPGS